jgi:hypothetical protein
MIDILKDDIKAVPDKGYLSWKKPAEYTICPACRKNTFKINYSTMERYCIECGFSSTRRGTENVDQD